ncbi:MAG TPA: hypothetical protein VGM32_07040 [Rhodopila sp.]
MIEGVIVAGDLVRPDGSGRPGGTDRPTLWLWNAVKRSIYLATGLATEALTTTTDPALYRWVEALRAPASADAHWASVYARMPSSASLDELVLDRFRRRFCVGYEMPPWLLRLLDENAIPYIDLRLHPIRFMDDLMFAARPSRIETQAALLPMAVAESEVIITAGLREAMCRFISEARVPDNTLLVAGQRPFDSTQIVDGGFFDAEPLAAEVHAICARYAGVVLKPHPHDRHHSLLFVASTAPAPMLGVIDDNIYRMMALPQIGAVLTVNSGVAHEAPYFGKRVHTLAPLSLRPVWRGAEADATSHVSLDDVVLTPDFWRIALAPLTRVTATDGIRLRPKPNRLRIALDSFWNFQQIDTDRIPREAAATPCP